MNGQQPRKEVIDMGTRKIGRDSGSGQFIPVQKAIKLGNRAEVETIRTPPKKG
jgi:hypothetical protein